MDGFNKYENPDKRCEYPFEPCAVGYCWSYANFVDDGDKFLRLRGVEKFEDICAKGCSFWRPNHKGDCRGGECCTCGVLKKEYEIKEAPDEDE